MKKRIIPFIVFLSVVFFVCLVSGLEFAKMWKIPDLYPSEGLNEMVMLSHWFDGLKGSPLDTPVYIFKGSLDGGKILILGGTHANEPAGYMAAAAMIENITADSGSVYIIPCANISALTHTDPMEGAPQFFSIPLPNGETRSFNFGSRKTNSIHQWPDPTIYFHQKGNQLGGSETLNLNRSYPGLKNGNPTEKLAYAIVQLIKSEKIEISVDLHESSPEYPVNNAIVFHQDAAELAITAQMMLEMEDVDIRLEESPLNLSGLSHREWGDETDTLAVLIEVSNPSQGRMRGKTDEALILTGKDKFYVKAAERKQLFVPYDEEGYSIDLRAARHIKTISSIIDSWNMLVPEKEILVSNIPEYYEILDNSLGSFLNSKK